MILRKEIDSYKLHLEEIKKYANEHDLLKGNILLDIILMKVKYIIIL